MTFSLFSLPIVFAGITVLAAGLWLIQRLRVQHREVEVQTTLFWNVAIRETRARVFVRRFRHWWAWVFLCAIASLLWMLVARPEFDSSDGVQHVVLVSHSDDVDTALQFAATLPSSRREVIAAGARLETLLRPNEQVELARLRSEDHVFPAPDRLEPAIEALAARATADRPLTIHVVGRQTLDAQRVDALLARAARDSLRLSRVDSAESRDDPVRLQTFGVADNADGRWDAVDLWIAFDETDGPVALDRVSLTSSGQPVVREVQQGAANRIEVAGLAADGSTIAVAVDGKPIGTMTLPDRQPIRVQLQSDVPDTLRALVELDPACEIVTSAADVLIGSSADANLRLLGDEDPAFVIQAGASDAETELPGLIDELAIRQIDATSLAEQTRRVIEVTFDRGQDRSVGLWASLFSASYDFRESRACPVVISRSLRWLANTPPIVEWAAIGERLPQANGAFARPVGDEIQTADGRTLKAVALADSVDDLADVAASVSVASVPDAMLWMGLLAAVLLGVEWVLYQRGHMP